ncbi:hypothetical protein HY251_11675, partial [bacterium]|nr:hypothetical protein [bacterium]
AAEAESAARAAAEEARARASEAEARLAAEAAARLAAEASASRVEDCIVSGEQAVAPNRLSRALGGEEARASSQVGRPAKGKKRKLAERSPLAPPRAECLVSEDPAPAPAPVNRIVRDIGGEPIDPTDEAPSRKRRADDTTDELIRDAFTQLASGSEAAW